MLASPAGSEVDNLANAVESEAYKGAILYREFAEQAAADGDQAGAKRFAEIRGDEMGHCDAYKAALVQLNLGSER